MGHYKINNYLGFYSKYCYFIIFIFHFSVSLFNRCIPESVYLMAKALASSFTSVLGKSVLGKGYTQVIIT